MSTTVDMTGGSARSAEPDTTEAAPAVASPRRSLTSRYYLISLTVLAATILWPFVLRFLGVGVAEETRARVTGSLAAAAVTLGGLRILLATITRRGKVAAAWALIGIGCLVWAAGAVVAVDLGLSPVGGPGLGAMAVSLNLAGVMLILTGTALLPDEIPLTRSGLLDLLTVLLAVMAVLWSTSLPLYADSSSSATGRVLLATLGSVMVMAGTSIVARGMLNRHIEFRGLVWALLLGGVAMVVVAPLEPGPLYTLEARVADGLWTAMGIAFFAAGSRLGSPTPRDPTTSSQIERIQGILPGAATIVGIVAVATHEGLLEGIDPVMAALGIGLLGVSALRAAVMHLQNMELFGRLRESATALTHVGRQDGLTGLGNRLALEERLDTALRAQSPYGVSVFFIDIDNFKDVNDSLGHLAGDTLLKILAERLTGVLGGEVYRVGGDEFVAVREDMDAASSEAVAAAIVAALSPPVLIGPHRIPSGSSVGLARSAPRRDGTRRPDDAQLLLRRADLALYRAKELGRRQWSPYEPWLQERADRRLSLQQNLQQGLDRDEFGVVYQPVVELATGRVLGAEALVRWNTDEFGTLLPQEFLPLFAEGGLMEDLGNVVFQKAVADLAGLAEFEGFLSVNLSREELVSPDLLQRLNHMLATHEVPTERIRLEMTERDVLNQRIRSTMSTASEMGFGICIEDFGTGPTSLRHLAEFTGLSLKMDRSFLRSFGRDKSDQVILSAVTDLADELGFVVGVEAVTSVQQRDSVLRLGVTQAQGWYFGRPGNLSEAARLAATVPETSSQTDQAPS